MLAIFLLMLFSSIQLLDDVDIVLREFVGITRELISYLIQSVLRC